MNTLSQARLQELLHYDPDTGVFTWLVARGGAKAGDNAGITHTTRTGKSYRRIMIAGRNYMAHRLAWLYTYGQFPEDQTDHINGDGVDNRLSNIRTATASENMRNQRLHSDNTSGTCGVHLNKLTKKWVARICIDGKLKHIGYFVSIDDAITARKEAEIKHGYHVNHGSDRLL